MTGYKITALSEEGRSKIQQQIDEWNFENWRNRALFKTIFKRTITSNEPLILNIELRGAIPVNINDLINRSKEELKKEGLTEGKDFSISSTD
jgi:hypothetical protein